MAVREGQGGPLDRPPADHSSGIDTLLAAAVLAPSGDNTQPWRFTVERSQGTIDLDVEPQRDPSPMNAGQRMARISLGAVLENMVQTAERNNWAYQVADSPAGALARFSVASETPAGTIEPTLSDRNTNRRVYAGQKLAGDVLKKLEAVVGPFASAKSVLITDSQALSRLVALVSRADSLILGTQAIRNAFLAKVRFDAAPTDEVELGLSLGSLEVSASDRLSLRLMHALPPPDGLMRVLGARRIFSRVASKLAASASAICLVTTSRSDAQGDLDVGRAWQRIWLELTRQKLAGQPMMSLLVLKNVIEQGNPQLLSPRDLVASKSLLDEFHALSTQLVDGNPAALMRIGVAAAPTSRVRRLPPAASTRFR